MIVLEIIFLMYIRVEVKENTEKEREKIDSLKSSCHHRFYQSLKRHFITLRRSCRHWHC